MSEDLYRVIVNGYAADKGEYFIEMEFAKLFKITPEKSRKILRASPTTIKMNLSIEKANQYKYAIEKTGVLCELENMKYDISGLSLE
ncbi:MAG: hypothetical protein LJE83_02410 [Gammaproteobacteria bacterium]|nr:hypothetical protein [Gammaproteobacteria bacterium]